MGIGACKVHFTERDPSNGLVCSDFSLLHISQVMAKALTCQPTVRACDWPSQLDDLTAYPGSELLLQMHAGYATHDIIAEHSSKAGGKTEFNNNFWKHDRSFYVPNATELCLEIMREHQAPALLDTQAPLDSSILRT